MTDTPTLIGPQERLQSAAALIHAATTHLLATEAAPEHATDLIDLHLAQGQIRLLLDAAHQDVPTVLVTDRPGVLLHEATQLLGALPDDQQSELHEVRLLLERATTWTAML
jgi:hypothetical protein